MADERSARSAPGGRVAAPPASGEEQPPPHQDRLIALLRSCITLWALAGGLIIVGLVLMTGASAVSNLIWGTPFSGDFELVKHLVAVAAFAFLPYCQLTGSNVTVDIFTEGMDERPKAAMQFLASAVAAALAALLFWQMWKGMFDYMRYPEYTQVLGIPLWTAFPPMLASLVLLFVASLITAGDAWRTLRAPRTSAPDGSVPNLRGK
jgi:TRAP-type C4-dicarboxylate transport system permease small subunit